jgi:hypothetical protein
VGTVLEAIKERGEVVTKVAYGDWKRAGDHSRSMTQHAIQMVQRNLTPGGDKNGADINLALDALEMAFTRNHINAFVIVGGDSDFIALVEKLKQYDKKVLVCGGRSFTSIILQKNCHEFIAYENLIAPQQPPRRPAERARVVEAGGDSNLAKALPLVRRALKVLSDREVSPQLGLLKSTLLQLDSTFTERDYGVSTFRDFIEKMASAGYVNLKQVDRSLLVELTDSDGAAPPEIKQEFVAAESAPPSAPVEVQPQTAHQPSPSGPTPSQVDEVVKTLRDVFRFARVTPHWPMYLRNVKQYVKNAAPAFDERRFGFGTFLEAVRAGQRAGLFRLERNRQGILRVFPGNQFPQHIGPLPEMPLDVEDETRVVEAAAVMEEQIPVLEAEPIVEAAPETLVAEAESVEEPVPAMSEEESEPAPAKKRRAPARKKPAAPRAKSAAPRRSRKKPPEPATEP